MRITKVEATIRDPERVSLFVDGEFALACHALVWMQSGLHIGSEVLEPDLARLRDDEALRALKDRALGLIAGRPRGRTELRQQLLRGTPAHPGPAAENVDLVLDQLAASGLIDDQAFAEFWVEQRDRFRPKGSLALRAELRSKGVARDDIEAVVAPDRDSERAISAGRRKAEALVRRNSVDARAFRDALGPYLMRRGFNGSIVREAIATLWRECTAAASGIDEALEEVDLDLE